MKKFRELFESTFHMSLPPVMPPEESLVPIAPGADPGSAVLWGTKPAAEAACLIQAHLGDFLTMPPGYFMIGFWGHGINSYAFYYVRVDSRSRVFFRLPYGGVFMDNEKHARQIGTFLTRWFETEARFMEQVRRFTAVDSMGAADFDVVLLDGRPIRFTRSLFEEPEAWSEFEALLRRGPSPSQE